MKRTLSWGRGSLGLAVIAAIAAVAMAPHAKAAKGPLKVKITRSAHGIPTIEAKDYKSLGFGYGYAFAEDNICTIADSYVTIRAERSRFFGPDEPSPEGFENIDSDFFFQRINQRGVVEELIAQEPPLGPKSKVRRVVEGYVKGYNRYLKQTGVADIPDPRCAGAQWVRPIKPIDVYRRVYELTLYASGGVAIDGVATARPPGADASAPAPRGAAPTPSRARIKRLGEALDFSQEGGSNAYALGKEATKSGRGMVLINPHFPWDGPRRLYQSHLRIPGELHVSGASLYGVPVVLIGHTRKLSWMHPVSPAFRFVPFELDLAPGDPTSYLVDGEPVPMERDKLTVQVKQPDGSIQPQTRTLYTTRYGPMFNAIQGQSVFGWGADTGYALFDANAENLGRVMNHFFDVDHAESTKELLGILQKYEGIPWVHTIAADRKGRALYADIGSIPNVPDQKAASCSGDLGELTFSAFGLPVLDGSRSECALEKAPDSLSPGILGDSQLPHLFRSDYVANMNDSYWLSNPQQPLEGYPRIVGDERTERSLRTRLGLSQIRERLAGEDGMRGKKFTLGRLRRILFENRHYGGELWRSALVELCDANPIMQGSTGPVDVSEGCAALAGWDEKVDVDSRGALLFVRFMERFDGGDDRFSHAFDVNSPIATPFGLNTASNVERALADAVSDLRSANIPLGASYGDYHYETRGEERIPIPGGSGGQGVFNDIGNEWEGGVGYPDVTSGSSFIMVTSFSKRCPRDGSLTTYSQSENPDSRFHSDQTWMFSREKWVDPPFCAREVERAAKSVNVLRAKR